MHHTITKNLLIMEQKFHEHNRLICKYLFIDVEPIKINPALNVHDINYTKPIKK